VRLILLNSVQFIRKTQLISNRGGRENLLSTSLLKTRIPRAIIMSKTSNQTFNEKIFEKLAKKYIL